jgi:hypothetical protein
MLRLARQQLRRRLRRVHNTQPAPSAFRQRLSEAVEKLGDEVHALHWADLPAGSARWTTVTTLPAGSEVTLLAAGEARLSRLLRIGAGPKAALWYRMDGGDAHKIAENGHSLKLDHDTRVELIATIPGEFTTKEGEFGPEVPRAKVSGKLLAAVVVWRRDAETGLRAALAHDQRLFAVAAARPERATPPGNWRYLWRLGEGRIYGPCDEAPEALCCHTEADVGILQHPVSLPLDDNLRLRWQWLAEQLPSTLPEHTQPTHDYLSIAVEFDNGLDLTYMWSSGLAIDTVFQCPLSWWDQRETHWVIRNDPKELGQWLSEERHLLADYHAAIGGTPPERVVGVWLIANSLFQRGVGACRYRDIALVDGTDAVTPVPIG